MYGLHAQQIKPDRKGGSLVMCRFPLRRIFITFLFLLECDNLC